MHSKGYKRGLSGVVEGTRRGRITGLGELLRVFEGGSEEFGRGCNGESSDGVFGCRFGGRP